MTTNLQLAKLSDLVYQPNGGTTPQVQAALGADWVRYAILSGALDDNIGGRGGNDWIEAGTGSDYVNGEDGNDLIEGGTDGDILAGDANDDVIYGNVEIATADAIANGNNDTASGEKGDWLAGNDTLTGGQGNDVVFGCHDTESRRW